MTSERWRRVEELYQAALAESPDRRSEFLNQACAGDPLLRDEVETLLNFVSKVGSFLENPPDFSRRDGPPVLLPGEKLGIFEVLELIGKGGMGEVYRARDTRLGRDVALKALPVAFAGNPELRLRLEREARVLATLNHPHIAAIYGLEESERGQALVLEFVPGPTLADRISKGALPMPEAIAIAKQIAEALEYAHERGVIHRDLKPTNVKITPDGRVKVLDFGLAKIVETYALPGVRDNSTPSPEGSQSGFILGTPAYMAPEQARGKAVDKRADIWAFGVVLYEMLTRQCPFQGGSPGDTLAAVLRHDPDWQALPSAVPADIRKLLRRCLNRDPSLRLRDIGDARISLEECLMDPQLDSPVVKPDRRTVGPWIVVSALALGVVLAVSLSNGNLRREQPLIRLDVDLGPDSVLDATYGANVILSPDGSRLVFSSHAPDGQTRLATRRMDQSQSNPLLGTEGAKEPFFSPDGLWVGFFVGLASAGKLKKVSIDGGEVITVCDAPAGHGASWGESGTIIAALDWNRGLSRVPAGGGTPKPLTDLKAGETSHRWPQILPDGRAVVFTSGRSMTNRFDIQIKSLENGQTKVLQGGASYGRYLPSGHLVFVRDGALIATPFDPRRLEVTGPAVTVLDKIEYFAISGGAEFAFDRNGTVIYGKNRPTRNTLQWLNQSGELRPLLATPDDYADPRFSPDGKKLSVDVERRGIGIYALEQGTMTRLPEGVVGGLTWTPDGKRVALGFGDGIYLMKADGSGTPEKLTWGTAQGLGSFTRDGKWFAYTDASGNTSEDLWTLSLQFDASNHAKLGKPELFLGSPAEEGTPEFSPDGGWIAYSSNESGIMEVYVRPFPERTSDSGGKWLISSGGGEFPVWSRSGRELFYQNHDNRIMVVDWAAKGSMFQASKPRLWSPTRFVHVFPFSRSFDMSPDGKHAVVVMPAPATEEEQARAHQVVFLQNMFDELKRTAHPGLKEAP